MMTVRFFLVCDLVQFSIIGLHLVMLCPAEIIKYYTKATKVYTSVCGHFAVYESDFIFWSGHYNLILPCSQGNNNALDTCVSKTRM